MASFINDDAPVSKGLRTAKRITIPELLNLMIQAYNKAPISPTQTAQFDPNAYTDIGSRDSDLMAVVSYNDSQVIQDLSNIVFDRENLSADNPPTIEYGTSRGTNLCGFRTLPNGLTFCGAVACGDWEMPLFFLVYYDGSSLRGYVPARGNMVNCDTFTAFGSEVNMCHPNMPYTMPQLYAQYKTKGFLTPKMASLDDFITDSAVATWSYMAQYSGIRPDTAGFEWNAVLEEITETITVM